MKRNTPNSTISVIQSTPEASHKDAVTSTENHPSLDEETIAAGSMYASFYWLINYIKMCNARLANDMYTSFMSYWFPGRVLLPPHLLHLIQVHNRLRAERESHTVTYSRERAGPLSVRSIVDTIKSYILSSEDVAGIRYTPKDIEYLASDREPMFVIVDSSRVSNPRARQKRQFNKNAIPVDMPSTSRDHRNDFMSESESADEMQMIDINLRSDNELLVGSDSECDNDSIVLSYIKNKDSLLDLEVWSEDSNSEDNFVPADLPTPSIPSLRPGLAEVCKAQPAHTVTPIDQFEGLTEAIEILHRDNEFLIAAELGNDNLVRILIDEGTNIHVVDHLGRNALHFAVHSENRIMVERLLKAGVDPNVQDDLGMTPLAVCLMRSPTYRMANLLLDYGALLTPRLNPVQQGLFIQFVMMCIPTSEEEKILRLLVVKAGALVDDPEAPGGRQPLHFAAMSNNIRLIEILLDLGANLVSVNHRNERPKQVAEIFRSKEAYALLQNYEELACFIEPKTINIKPSITKDSNENINIALMSLR